MSDKKHISLKTSLLAGSLGAMLMVSLFLGLSFSALTNNIIKDTTINSVNKTMNTLDEEIKGILSEYNDLVINLSNIIPTLKNS